MGNWSGLARISDQFRAETLAHLDSWFKVSERSYDGSVGRPCGRAHVGCHSEHIVALNFVKYGLLLAQDLEHDRHEEHEGDARAVPEKLLGEVLDDVEEVVSLIDETEDEVSVVVDQDALGSPLFGLASLHHLFRYATHVNICNIGLPAHKETLRLVKTLKLS